jgi:hypothetical protein
MLHKVINLTPQPITVVDIDHKIAAVIPPSGTVAEVKIIEDAVVGVLNRTICVFEIEKRIEGLPQQEKGTWYIVSLEVANQLRGKRNDLLVAYNEIRDEKVIGYRGLARL